VCFCPFLYPCVWTQLFFSGMLTRIPFGVTTKLAGVAPSESVLTRSPGFLSSSTNLPSKAQSGVGSSFSSTVHSRRQVIYLTALAILCFTISRKLFPLTPTTFDPRTLFPFGCRNAPRSECNDSLLPSLFLVHAESCDVPPLLPETAGSRFRSGSLFFVPIPGQFLFLLSSLLTLFPLISQRGISVPLVKLPICAIHLFSLFLSSHFLPILDYPVSPPHDEFLFKLRFPVLLGVHL